MRGRELSRRRGHQRRRTSCRERHCRRTRQQPARRGHRKPCEPNRKQRRPDRRLQPGLECDQRRNGCGRTAAKPPAAVPMAIHGRSAAPQAQAATVPEPARNTRTMTDVRSTATRAASARSLPALKRSMGLRPQCRASHYIRTLGRSRRAPSPAGPGNGARPRPFTTGVESRPVAMDATPAQIPDRSDVWASRHAFAAPAMSQQTPTPGTVAKHAKPRPGTAQAVPRRVAARAKARGHRDIHRPGASATRAKPGP
jgi:hypothetical protein